MNGIDALIIATGNDFRAVEAACHTHASKSGQYRSLTHCRVETDVYLLDQIPLALALLVVSIQIVTLVVKALKSYAKCRRIDGYCSSE